MENKTVARLKTLFVAFALLPLAMFSQYWADEVGGVFNIPSVEFNPIFTGYGSKDNVIINKIDLQTGETMEIVNRSPLYDPLGNQVATAWASAIGLNHETNFRDGGIIAGAITDIKVGNTTHKMVHAWSVNTQEGGRQSGWIKLSDLSPSDDIGDILTDNDNARMAILRDAGVESATYEENRIVEATLPDFAEEYYLFAGRSSTQGKAKYYYSRDGLISGLMNVPDTGRQRYGVANNNIPLNAIFYRDINVDRVTLSIYEPSSSKTINHSLRLVWGYTNTSAGERIYSWINERTLEPTQTTNPNPPTTDGNLVHITKRNATRYAIDGGRGGANRQNVTLSAANIADEGQLWVEIDRGNGFYSYEKFGTNYSLDGSSGGATNQSVYLWKTSATRRNQQWQKQAVGDGGFKLIKRNAKGFAINGGSSGVEGRNINLWSSASTNQNLQWFITPVGTSAKSISSSVDDGLINNIFMYPNPVESTTTVENAANATFTIYAMDSSLLFIQTISSDIETIDLSGLASGIYFAEIKGATSLEVIKLVKH